MVPRVSPIASYLVMSPATVRDGGSHSMTDGEIDANAGPANTQRDSGTGGGKAVDGDVGKEAAQPASKPSLRWYQRLNPIRLQQAPPVPSERTISKEYGAGLLSIITFQWMHPLMLVSVSFFFFGFPDIYCQLLHANMI